MNLPKLLEQMRGRLAAATLKQSPTLPDLREWMIAHDEFVKYAPTDLAFALDALEIALGALESICIEGSERYENTADQVPRDHLVALLVVARGKAFWARTKINELAKARGE